MVESGRDLATFLRILFECRAKISRPHHSVAGPGTRHPQAQGPDLSYSFQWCYELNKRQDSLASVFVFGRTISNKWYHGAAFDVKLSFTEQWWTMSVLGELALLEGWRWVIVVYVAVCMITVRFHNIMSQYNPIRDNGRMDIFASLEDAFKRLEPLLF